MKETLGTFQLDAPISDQEAQTLYKTQAPLWIQFTEASGVKPE